MKTLSEMLDLIDRAVDSISPEDLARKLMSYGMEFDNPPPPVMQGLQMNSAGSADNNLNRHNTMTTPPNETPPAMCPFCGILPNDDRYPCARRVSCHTPGCAIAFFGISPDAWNKRANNNCGSAPSAAHEEEAMKTRQTKSAFVLDRMPWEKDWTIRIVLPGIDGLHAVWLETCARETREEAEALLDRIMDGLQNVRRERPTTNQPDTTDGQ